MRLRTFIGRSTAEAMAAVRAALGPDAVIVSAQDDGNGNTRVTAALDERELQTRLAQVALEKLTPMTIVDRAKLRVAIRKARADGYCLVDQEAELGFRSISVPLRRLDGRVIASLNIGAHSRRCTLETMRLVFLPRLLGLAGELRDQMI